MQLDSIEEGMLEAHLGGGAFTGVERQHGQQPISEILSRLRVPFVFLSQHFEEAPRLQFRDVTQFT